MDRSLRPALPGESNIDDPTYDRVFATFRTLEAYEPQFDAVVESFESSAVIDFEAPFLEPLADLESGHARAGFAFPGAETVLDYRPDTGRVNLNTEFTQIQPVGAGSFPVVGGVFEFRNVTIPQGVTVRGSGSKPMVWLASGDFVVDGELTVSGGEGGRVTSLRAAGVPTPGGVGVCGGGSGGRGSPNTTSSSPTGEPGFGPGQAPGGGGGAGRAAVTTTCSRGSAGGGGSFATQGDPFYPVKGNGNVLPQQRGTGGSGCLGASGSATRVLPGGGAGPVGFVDARIDNDFWGSGVDVSRQIRITGELAAPRGGGGGGGGGDFAQPGQNFNNNSKGGGGGGGGGVLVVWALGDIRVGPSGIIRADGGDGGGGQSSGGNTEGGGGGAGSGGMVILIAGRSIRLSQHGETYANRDWGFSVSADGGVGEQGTFGGGASWDSKYPPPGLASVWDNRPSGAFGGLGMVQMMAPSGDDSDGTGTVLDDNIEILDDLGLPTRGAEKRRYIAWRGYPIALGTWVDDNGNPTYASNPSTRDNEGDIRPAPILLPGPVNARSRLRSRWIDTGATVRRLLVAPDGEPRGIVEDPANGLLAGPRYEFAGTSLGTSYQGYVEYAPRGSGVRIPYPSVLPAPAAIAAIEPNATFEGVAAYRLTLQTAALGAILDRYAHYQAQLLDAGGNVAGEYRILGHSDRVLHVGADQGGLPASLQGLRLQVLAKFFDIRTGGVAGLGAVYTDPVTNRTVPAANVQLGFAFHRDAPQALPSGLDPNRFPQQVGSFLTDLADPVVQECLRTFSCGGSAGRGAPYVQWDVVFNLRFSERDRNNVRPTRLSPNPVRPELHLLALPYRF